MKIEEIDFLSHFCHCLTSVCCNTCLVFGQKSYKSHYFQMQNRKTTI